MIKRLGFFVFFLGGFFLFGQQPQVEIMVLGIAQDAGAPQIQCKKDCCRDRWQKQDLEQVSALGIVDRSNAGIYLIDATPDIGEQLQAAQSYFHAPLKGIFLTHAHIGHYSGLMYLGKEALGAKKVPVYAMERMRNFLSHNGPWSQLVQDQNILLHPLTNEMELSLSPQLQVTPLRVPHRDEYSETVGYRIQGPKKSALYIPDIDKWNQWEKDILAAIKEVDYAFLDATFYDGKELGNRDMSLIPHPFVKESMQLFEVLSPKERNKIYFIHLNHTNPLLKRESKAYKALLSKGYHLAQTGQTFTL